MRKFTILLFLVVTVSMSKAQPVLNSSLNFSFGDSYKMDSYTELTTANPGQAGANVSWDFENISGGTYVEGASAICVDPTNTPFADSVVAGLSNICLRPLDDPYYGAYQYYSQDAGTRYQRAIGWYETGNTSYGTYSEPLKTLEFPLSFGDSFTNNYEYTSFHLGFGCYFMRDSAEVVTEADAWGTIKTPAGEFVNVLRLKTTTMVYSWYRFAAGTPWMFTGVFNDVRYDWYSPALKVPVFVLNQMEFDKKDYFYNIQYLVEYDFLTRIKEKEQSQILIGPNPATNTLNIYADAQTKIQGIRLFNQLGEIVLEKDGENQLVDIAHLTAGLYLTQIRTKNQVIQQKIIIK